MPQYHWYAVDGQGEEFEGTAWASNEAALKELLSKHAMMPSFVQRLPLLPRGQRLTQDEALYFFEHLHRLLSVGLLLSPALKVMARHGSAARRAVATELEFGVAQGSTLSDILVHYPEHFDPLIIALISAGQNAGALVSSLERIVRFLRLRSQVRKKIWAALAAPLITVGFFFAIALIIFTVIVPRLQQVVALANQRQSESLQGLFAISNWLHAMGLVWLGVFSIAITLFVWLITRLAWWQRFIAWIVTHMYGVRTIYWSLQISFFLQSVSLLVQGGLSLAPAIELVSTLSGNSYVRKRFTVLSTLTHQGVGLDQAYEQVFDRWALPEVSAMLAVGNEVSALAPMMDHAADFYFERAQNRLKRFLLVLQPAILVCVGIGVTLLIYAVYAPLVRLPEMMVPY